MGSEALSLVGWSVCLTWAGVGVCVCVCVQGSRTLPALLHPLLSTFVHCLRVWRYNGWRRCVTLKATPLCLCLPPRARFSSPFAPALPSPLSFEIDLRFPGLLLVAVDDDCSFSPFCLHNSTLTSSPDLSLSLALSISFSPALSFLNGNPPSQQRRTFRLNVPKGKAFHIHTHTKKKQNRNGSETR